LREVKLGRQKGSMQEKTEAFNNVLLLKGNMLGSVSLYIIIINV
jgi:hypothetical protein